MRKKKPPCWSNPGSLAARNISLSLSSMLIDIRIMQHKQQGGERGSMEKSCENMKLTQESTISIFSCLGSKSTLFTDMESSCCISVKGSRKQHQ